MTDASARQPGDRPSVPVTAAVGALAGFEVFGAGGADRSLARTGLAALVGAAVLGTAARFGVEFARGYGDGDAGE